MYSIRNIHTPKEESSKATKAYRFFAFISASLLVVLCAGAIYAKVNNQQFLSVQSPSMVPALHKGDLVTVTSVSRKDLKKGDVITYTNPKNPRETITHRIIAIDPFQDTVQTKGDANKTADTPIHTHFIIGRVAYSTPYLGSAVDVVRHPIGLLAIIYIPAIIIVATEMRRLAAYYKTVKPYRLYGWRPHAPANNSPGFKLAARVGAVVVIATPLLTAPLAHALLSSSTTLTSSTISTVTLPGPTPTPPTSPVVFSVCKFPTNSSLTSYAAVDALQPKQTLAPLPLDAPIPAGTYKVTATSTDNHKANPNEPTQPNERWLAYLYTNGDTTPTYTTGVTDDIPNTIDQVATVVAPALTVTEPITAIRYVHNAMITGLENAQFGSRAYDQLTAAEKRRVLWNSVHPGCLTFEAITGQTPAATVRP